MTKQDINKPWQKEQWFYKRKNGTIFPYYKEDILKEINVFKPDTFLWILEDMDYPFFEEEWLRIVKHCLINGRRNILGRYISKMRLFGYKGFHFEDSIYTENIDTYFPEIVWEKILK